VFRQGIHLYLSDHLYTNTTTADLWAALEQASGKPIRSMADRWTRQPGLPVVKVGADCRAAELVVSLEQERFTVQDPGAQPLSWEIPVSLMPVGHPEAVRSVLLEGRTASVRFPGCGELIKANAGDTGYYRAWYEPASFRKLAEVYDQLPVADRLNFLDDAWAMVEAGRASAIGFLGLCESMRSETSYAVWSQIISTLDLIDELQRHRPGARPYQQWACGLLRPQLARLGWEAKAGEPDTDALLRSLAIIRLAVFGDAAVIAEAGDRYRQFLTAPAALPADLRPAVLTVVGRYSDKPTYDQIHARSRRARGSEERQLCYRVLAGALDPKLAEATLGLSLTDELTPQEATALVLEVARQGEHPELAWPFFQHHAKALLAKVDAFDRNNYVPSILGTFSDSPRADELEAYVRSHFPRDALVKARESAENIRFKAALKQRALPEIDAWIARHGFPERN